MATDTRTDTSVRFGLHAGQASVYRDPHRFKVVVAGRRWGKTQLARVRLIMWALKGSPGRYWYVAPDRIMARDLMWQPLKDAVDPSWLAASPRETDLSITLCTGAEISLHGAEDPDRLRGRGLRGVVLDEFADMKPDVWQAVIRPQLSDYQAPAEFYGTPKSFNHFHHLYSLGQSTADADRDWRSWQFRTIDNPTLPAGEADAARRDMDERTYRQEYEASFEGLSGRVYYAFHRNRHVRPVTLVPSLPVCVSFDFNINPCTAVIGQRVGHVFHVWREVRTTHAGGEATLATALAVREHLGRNASGVRIYGDPAGSSGKTTGPSDHAVLRQVFPGATWCIPHAHPHVRDRVAAVNTALQTMAGDTHLVVDPSCVHLLADLEQVVYADNGDLDKRTNPALTHLSDALGYWVERDAPAVMRSLVAAIKTPQAGEQPSATVDMIRAQKRASLRAQLEAARG